MFNNNLIVNKTFPNLPFLRITIQNQTTDLTKRAKLKSDTKSAVFKLAWMTLNFACRRISKRHLNGLKGHLVPCDQVSPTYPFVGFGRLSSRSRDSCHVSKAINQALSVTDAPGTRIWRMFRHPRSCGSHLWRWFRSRLA